MSQLRRLLWVTPRSPLPAQDGARQATFHLVNSLAKLGVEIDLLAFALPDEAVDEAEIIRAFGVKRVTIERRKSPRHFKNILARPWIPLTIAPYATAAAARALRLAYAACGAGSLVIFDGLHSAGAWSAMPCRERGRIPFVVRAHNIEADLWKLGASQRIFPLSVLLNFQAKLMTRFERRICRAARLVACVSTKDETGLSARYGPIATTVTPIGVPMTSVLKSQSFTEKKNLLFIGRLDWQPNRDGLKWFLEEVWPLASAQSPDLTLTIAGAGENTWLQPYLGLPRLEFLGRVQDLTPLYEQAAAALVPIFFGSGTRVKAIEAASYARPCISTAIGIEGIGLNEETDYYRGESAKDWLRILSGFSLPDARWRGTAALAKVAENYQPDNVARRFLKSLEHA